jgi:acyl dehydratase
VNPPRLQPSPVRATSVAELKAYVGRELGPSEWRPVTQEDVDAFAAATGDQQWIHTDPVRAADGPFGGTIAHGYYTLSLAPVLLEEVLQLDAFAFSVNYGLNKLRFPAPLKVGESVRLRAELVELEEFAGGAALTVQLTFERSDGDKPACVATALYRVLEEEPQT